MTDRILVLHIYLLVWKKTHHEEVTKLENDHRAEPNVPALHVFERLVRLLQRESLHHTFDVVQPSEGHRIFAIFRSATQKAVDRETPGSK